MTAAGYRPMSADVRVNTAGSNRVLDLLVRMQIKVLRLFECGLLMGLLFHSLNGIRIVIVDFFPKAVRKEKMLTAWVVALTLLAGIPGSFVILKPWLDGNIF